MPHTFTNLTQRNCWIHRYSTYNKKGAVVVVDKDSQTEEHKQLQQKIAHLEQIVGYKQMQSITTRGFL